MYVLVRTDLPFSQQAVQAIHAGIEATRKFAPFDDHPHLVLCSIPNEESLQRELEQLKSSGIQMAEFREEDLGGSLTAIASEIISGDKRKTFRKYQLLKGIP